MKQSVENMGETNETQTQPSYLSRVQIPQWGLITYRSLIFPSHCDHIGHMNVRWYAHHFDEAGFQIWNVTEVCQSEMRDRGLQVVVARTTIDYIKEMIAGTSIVVRGGFTRVGNKSVTHQAKMFNEDTGELCATQETVEVFFDPLTRQSTEMPKDFNERLSALLVEID